MLIVDTSAVLEALVARRPDPLLVDRLSGDGDLHAPHLIDVEFLHGLRGLERSGQVTPDRAADARTDFANLPITRYPHEPLASRAWALRHNVTAYDAMFVALAETTGTTLITCDARLATAAASSVSVECFDAAG